jgi:hypothetical protein
MHKPALMDSPMTHRRSHLCRYLVGNPGGRRIDGEICCFHWILQHFSGHESVVTVASRHDHRVIAGLKGKVPRDRLKFFNNNFSASGNLSLLAKLSLSSMTVTLNSAIFAITDMYLDMWPAPKMKRREGPDIGSTISPFSTRGLVTERHFRTSRDRWAGKGSLMMASSLRSSDLYFCPCLLRCCTDLSYDGCDYPAYSFFQVLFRLYVDIQ